jgi:hypothetical protein
VLSVAAERFLPLEYLAQFMHEYLEGDFFSDVSSRMRSRALFTQWDMEYYGPLPDEFTMNLDAPTRRKVVIWGIPAKLLLHNI